MWRSFTMSANRRGSVNLLEDSGLVGTALSLNHLAILETTVLNYFAEPLLGVDVGLFAHGHLLYQRIMRYKAQRLLSYCSRQEYRSSQTLFPTFDAYTVDMHHLASKPGR